MAKVISFLELRFLISAKLASKYSGIPLDDIGLLLKSNIHEFRLTSLLILVQNYRKEDFDGKRKSLNLFDSYEKHK